MDSDDLSAAASIDEPAAPEHLDEAKELVLRAFAVAKAGGREDWRSMSIAVLKNRLLDLTQRSFDESRWGAATMREFVEFLPDLVSLDATTQPPTVRLHDAVDVEGYAVVAASEPARARGEWTIRQDLWDSVIDCVSGYVYVWDGERAVPFSPEEIQSDDPRIMPTVTGDELSSWRQAFAEEIMAGADDALRQEIEAWRDQGLSSQRLPPRLRNRWYGVLKRHVRARLDEWFAQRAEAPPSDGVVIRQVPRAAPRDDTEHMRSVVLRAVRQMTRAELELVSLPASVVARLTK